MKKLFLALLVSLSLTLSFSPRVVSAQEMTNGCKSEGQCVNNKKCVRKTYPGMSSGMYVVTPEGGGCGSSQIGGVAPPARIQELNGYGARIGLVSFMSILLNLFAVICGIWTMFNFLYSGWLLVTAQSDTKAQSEVKDRLTMTAIGLVIITSSYMVAGVIGLIFFKDPTYILNPTLQGALSTSTTP